MKYDAVEPAHTMLNLPHTQDHGWHITSLDSSIYDLIKKNSFKTVLSNIYKFNVLKTDNLFEGYR